MALDPVILFGVASGLPLVALGLWVATLRPRQPANLAFALFAAVFGLRAISSRFTSASVGQAQTLFAILEGALLLASAATVVHLTLVFPRRPEGAARKATILGGLVAAALSLVLVPFVVAVRAGGGTPPRSSSSPPDSRP